MVDDGVGAAGDVNLVLVVGVGWVFAGVVSTGAGAPDDDRVLALPWCSLKC